MVLTRLCSLKRLLCFKLRGTGACGPYSAFVEQNEPAEAIAPYLITQCVLGCLVGLAWGLLIFATDTASIRDLVSASSYPAATFVLFLLGSIIAILPVVLATAIGRLAE